MSKCIQCQGKLKRVASTNGQHYLCADCGEAGWCFVRSDQEWQLARNLAVPQMLQDTAFLRQQRQRLLKELQEVETALTTLRWRYVWPQLVDRRPIN